MRPSLQIGLLKSILGSHGFPVSTYHLNLDFVAKFGYATYERLFPTGGDQPRGVGEWLFSVAAFGDNAPDPGDEFLRTASDLSAEHTAALRDLRQGGIDQYLDELICSIDWAHYRVIGFTNTFAQTVPSLALAARIKTHHPEAIIVFGGANLDGPIGQRVGPLDVNGGLRHQR